jgi:competence protein ComEC
MPKSYAKKMLSKIFTFIIALGVGLNIAFSLNRPIATVIFTDVGQGDCTVILCNRKCIIIDGGDVGEGKNTIIPLLNYYGIRKVDIAILTHPHSDHAAGLLELIEAEKVFSIGTPVISIEENQRDSNSIFLPNELLYQLDAGDNVEICDKVKLFALSPSPDKLIEGEEGVNENSLVSLLQIGNTGILFMGDAGFQTEDNLIQNQDYADFLMQSVDFLKVGHHGSKYSTSSEFLVSMKIKAAVISVGPNYFGHPTDETLNRLIAENINVFRTDLNGAVILEIYENETRLQTMID